MKNQPRGIKWSAPVLIKKQGSDLIVVVPAQVSSSLDAKAGDVLNFTQLPDGSVQVWRVKKGTYSSLDDFGSEKKAPAKPAKKSAKPGKKKGGKRK